MPFSLLSLSKILFGSPEKKSDYIFEESILQYDCERFSSVISGAIIRDGDRNEMPF